MKLLPLILLASCQVQTQEPPPESVILVVDYGDFTHVWIRNNGIECWVYSNGEVVEKIKSLPENQP
jgi:hypothetical protein